MLCKKFSMSFNSLPAIVNLFFKILRSFSGNAEGTFQRILIDRQGSNNQYRTHPTRSIIFFHLAERLAGSGCASEPGFDCASGVQVEMNGKRGRNERETNEKRTGNQWEDMEKMAVKEKIFVMGLPGNEEETNGKRTGNEQSLQLHLLLTCEVNSSRVVSCIHTNRGAKF